ncbi:protein glutamate methyltransferase CheR associated with MCPs of class 36H [Geotalea daltonii FRC-32]|uniref:protein-glutamate O-methyltransferase n=1 Tax=Geotalea daltonii (strain DSM 22248 / JCM 15807 / FRC-32) TaxID=316067 RepID=B9M715_GEODF|nr:CheR family methyltransferase [Geotalea daltonii]ACM22036.1 protein glutamate methyltransferase CheR associated with MCPs of class 36H [Geotalea daltonii FRC-32]
MKMTGMAAAPAGKPPAPAKWDGKETVLFPLKDEEFGRLRELIHSIAGISLSPNKKDLVYSRLARRLRTRRLSSFTDYIGILESGNSLEREAFINALTTNMTSFFREAHHFPILARHLGSIKFNRPITIWTCASSTGEEPYSLAITAIEQFNSFNAPVRILATDIDTNVLKRARKGIYPLEQLQMLSSKRMKRFFLRGKGENDGFAKVKPELQQMITFRQLNLLSTDWGLSERFDAIFCRNVMIYFDKMTQQRVLTNLARYLNPHGLFFAGHAESFHHATDLFRLCGKTVYALRS